MTDSENIIISIDAWQKKKAASDSAAQTAASPSQYRAYEEHSQHGSRSMLRIEYGDGAVGLMEKSRLMEIQSSPGKLCLFFTSCTITMEGSNLDKLFDLIQDDKIRSLRCFNHARHDQPPAQDMLITSIERMYIHGFNY